MSSYQQKDFRTRYTCCCGSFQIETGACVIAFLGCILSLIEAYVSFMSTSFHHGQNVKSGVVYLFTAVMYLSVIAAQLQRRPGFYVPYLVFMRLGLILAAFVGVVLNGIAIIAPHFMIDDIDKAHPEYKMEVEKFRLLFGLSALAYGVSVALNCWLYYVIYRAYKFMQFDNGQYGVGGAAGKMQPV